MHHVADLIKVARDYVCKHSVDLIHSQTDQTIPNCTVVINTTSPRKKHCPEDPFSEFRSCEVVKENTQLLQDDPDKMVDEEIAKYKEMTCPHVTSGFDPLEWWGQHGQNLPILAGVSCNIFAIPATSSESERHFSLHKTVLSARRATLSPKAVEALVVVSSNMASGLI